MVTLCDVGAASAIRPDGTVTVRESAGSAAGPAAGARPGDAICACTDLGPDSTVWRGVTGGAGGAPVEEVVFDASLHTGAPREVLPLFDAEHHFRRSG